MDSRSGPGMTVPGGNDVTPRSRHPFSIKLA